MESDKQVETLNGCLMEWEQTFCVVYNLQNAAIGQKVIDITQDMDEFDAIMNKLKRENPVLKKIDSIILTQKKPVSWVIYPRVFEKGKLDDQFLPQIEQLAFKYNNSYAFNYLEEYYPKEYKDKLDSYLAKAFPKAKFTKGENFMIDGDWIYLREFITRLLLSDKPEYVAVATKKLRKNKWLADIDQWYNITLKEYNIKL